MACFNNSCRRIKIVDDGCCCLCVTSTCSDHCTRLCCQVTYTVTVKNNSNMNANNVTIHVPLDGVFCLDPSSVTLDGQPIQVEGLDSIDIGTLAPGQTSTVSYSCTVMEYKRYIKTRALVTFYMCCCCTRRDLGVYSNVNCLQVCPCCCNS